MDIFISDLHISSPLFKFEKEVTCLFNDPKVEAIYILGDLFDDWEECPTKTAKKKKVFIDMINNCSKIKVIIKGNHDPDIHVMGEIFPNILILERMELDLFGKKAILIHGDETDTSMGWTKTLFYVNYLLERVGFNLKAFIRNTVHWYLVWKHSVSPNSLVFKTEKALYKKYSKDYDIIISGHTHMPKIVVMEDAYFLNTGSVLYKPNYLVVDKNTFFIQRF